MRRNTRRQPRHRSLDDFIGFVGQLELEFDLGDVDISRMQPFQGNKHYLFEGSKETLGLLYADHFPYLQKKTARGVRRTPFHQHLLDNGAVMGELAGWERANWFANEGQTPEYEYSWKRQNFFVHCS